MDLNILEKGRLDYMTLFSVEEIVKVTELPIEKVKEIADLQMV